MAETETHDCLTNGDGGGQIDFLGDGCLGRSRRNGLVDLWSCRGLEGVRTSITQCWPYGYRSCLAKS